MIQVTSLLSPISDIYSCITITPKLNGLKLTPLFAQDSVVCTGLNWVILLLILSEITHVAPAGWEFS